MNDRDKPTVVPIARRFHEMGFRVLATTGTARYLRARGIPAEPVFKVHEGRPHGIDLIVNGEVQLLINTPLGKHSQRDDYSMRQAAVAHRIPYTTTLSAASAACDAILSLRFRPPRVRSLQEWHDVGRAATLVSRHPIPDIHWFCLMPVPLLDLRAQHACIKDDVMRAMMQVVERSALHPRRHRWRSSRRKSATLSHTRYAIGCASGTDALLLALRALDIGPGDEVITTPFTFFATAGTIHNVGATPVFVDIDPTRSTLDPEAARRRSTSRTKAVIPVDSLRSNGADRGVRGGRCPACPLIEDAAQIDRRATAHRRRVAHGRRARDDRHVQLLPVEESRRLRRRRHDGHAGRGARERMRNCAHARRDEDVLPRRSGLQQPPRFAAGGGARGQAPASRGVECEASRATRRTTTAPSPMSTDITTPMVDPRNESIYNQYTIRVGATRRAVGASQGAGHRHAIYYPLPLHLQPCFAYLGYK